MAHNHDISWKKLKRRGQENFFLRTNFYKKKLKNLSNFQNKKVTKKSCSKMPQNSFQPFLAIFVDGKIWGIFEKLHFLKETFENYLCVFSSFFFMFGCENFTPISFQKTSSYLFSFSEGLNLTKLVCLIAEIWENKVFDVKNFLSETGASEIAKSCCPKRL